MTLYHVFWLALTALGWLWVVHEWRLAMRADWRKQEQREEVQRRLDIERAARRALRKFGAGEGFSS